MDKKEAILQAALTLINQNGFHNAPMSKIAKEAGVASGSIYLYFESKQALIDALYMEIKIEMNDQIMRGYRKGEDIRDRLFHCWSHLLDFYLENPEKVKFLNQYAYSSYISECLMHSNLKIFEIYNEMIGEAIAQGILRDLQTNVILAYVIGPIKELQYQYEVEKIPIDEQTKRQMFEVLLGGLNA